MKDIKAESLVAIPFGFILCLFVIFEVDRCSKRYMCRATEENTAQVWSLSANDMMDDDIDLIDDDDLLDDDDLQKPDPASLRGK